MDLQYRPIHELPLESMARGLKPILEDKNFNNTVEPYAHTFAYIAKENYPGEFCRLASVKLFQSKNRDNINLNARNTIMKKGCDRDSLATIQPINYCVGILDGKFHRVQMKFCR